MRPCLLSANTVWDCIFCIYTYIKIERFFVNWKIVFIFAAEKHEKDLRLYEKINIVSYLNIDDSLVLGTGVRDCGDSGCALRDEPYS